MITRTSWSVVLLLTAAIPCFGESAATAPSGFGGIVLITTDRHIDSRWFHTPHDTGFNAVEQSEVYRGEWFEVLVMFGGPKVLEGKADVTYEVSITKPDGTSYFHEPSLIALQGPCDVRGKSVLIAEQGAVVCFDPPDPAGVYAISVRLKDGLGGEEVALTTEVKLVDDAADAPALSEAQVEELTATYYEHPNTHAFGQLLPLVHKWTDEKLGHRWMLAAFLAAIVEDQPYLLSDLARHTQQQTAEGRRDLYYLARLLLEKDPTRADKLGFSPQELAAIKQLPYPNPWDQEFRDAGELDQLWMNFFATGSYEPVRQIISALHLREDGGDVRQRAIGAAASWSLTSNCQQHPLVRDYCRWTLEEDKDLDAVTRRLLKQCLAGSRPTTQPKHRASPAPASEPF